MSKYYDRNGEPMDLMMWATTFEKSDRHVGNDYIGETHVSTVWLGLDHSDGNGPPLIFETMVFGGEHDQYTERYSTEAQAKKGHARIVKALKAGKAP